jgi:hypothetical protein
MVTAARPNCPFAVALAPLLLSAPLQETAHFAFQELANTGAPTNSCAMCHLLKFASQLHAPRRPSAPLAIATSASRAPASTDAPTGTAKFLICFPLAAAAVVLAHKIALVQGIALHAPIAFVKNRFTPNRTPFLPAAVPALLLLNVPMPAIATCASRAPASTDALTATAMCRLLKFASQLHAPRRPSAPLAIATCVSRAPASTDAPTGTAINKTLKPAVALALLMISVKFLAAGAGRASWGSARD